ncbi:MAG: ABC transporter substrate-binding protein [Alphaproteobacteria bacterium]
MKRAPRPLIPLLAAGVVLAATFAMAQEAGPLLDGRPGATILASPEPDSIDPIYAFPPNCLPIIGLPNSGINRLLANVGGDDLKFAVMAELSGADAGLGKAWRDGIQLAADAANAKGGIMGRRVVLDVRDVGSDSAGAEAVAEEILKEPPFAVFGALGESASIAANTMLRRSQMPMVLGTAGLDLQSAPESWITRGQTTQLSRLLQLADHAREEYKARSAALIWSETDYGRLRREVLSGAFRRRNLQLTVDAPILPGQTDFSDVLARVRALEPDVLFLMAHGQDAVRLLAGLRRQGYSKPILVDGDVMDAKFLAAAGQNANGLRGLAALHASAPVARVRMMADRFAQQFGYRPPVPGVNGFVAFNIMKASIEKACSLNAPDLFKTWRNLKLETRNDPGILMDLRIDWSGNVMRDEFVFEIRNGRPVIVKLQRALAVYN